MIRRASLTALVCLVFLAWCAPTGLAQSKPSDYFMEEFTFGLLGGMIGGPVLEAIYFNTLCREAPNPELCEGFGIVTMRIIVYTGPLPLVATAGIVSAGWLRGINGNWFLAYAYATVSSLSGWAISFSLIAVMDYFILSAGWNFLEPLTTPVYGITRFALPILFAAFFGTVGFNTDATMRQAVPAGWSVPLFSVRF